MFPFDRLTEARNRGLFRSEEKRKLTSILQCFDSQYLVI